MKEVTTIFYDNKNQTENLNRFIFLINTFTANDEGIVLNGQYARGIPFQDDANGSHYIIPGMMAIEILCKKASILSPKERKSNQQKLVIYSSGFLSTTFTLCFEDKNDKYHEIKCSDFYIIKTEGYYNIDNKYISVVKYREMQVQKNTQANKSTFNIKSSGNNSYQGSWTCSLCDGDETTGCLWNDPTECPKN